MCCSTYKLNLLGALQIVQQRKQHKNAGTIYFYKPSIEKHVKNHLSHLPNGRAKQEVEPGRYKNKSSKLQSFSFDENT